jgi:hypothetical protein
MPAELKGNRMPRLSTIAIDSRGLAPLHWSAAWVQRRLVEAYSVERRLPSLRQRMVAGAWPPIMVEFSDIVGRADEAREHVWQSWECSNVGVSAADIQRMEAAHDWLRVFLASYPVERECLSRWATAIAYQKSLRRLVLQRCWSRTTFYRHVSAGAHVIALELQRQEQPIS